MMEDALKFQVKYTERNTILVSVTAPCQYQFVACRSSEFCTYILFEKSVSLVRKELANGTLYFSMSLR
jgi:hypothetical protein